MHTIMDPAAPRVVRSPGARVVGVRNLHPARTTPRGIAVALYALARPLREMSSGLLMMRTRVGTFLSCVACYYMLERFYCLRFRLATLCAGDAS